MRIKFPCAVCVHKKWVPSRDGNNVVTCCGIHPEGIYGTMRSLECGDWKQKEYEVQPKPKTKRLILIAIVALAVLILLNILI